MVVVWGYMCFRLCFQGHVLEQFQGYVLVMCFTDMC